MPCLESLGCVTYETDHDAQLKINEYLRINCDKSVTDKRREDLYRLMALKGFSFINTTTDYDGEMVISCSTAVKEGVATLMSVASCKNKNSSREISLALAKDTVSIAKDMGLYIFCVYVPHKNIDTDFDVIWDLGFEYQTHQPVNALQIPRGDYDVATLILSENNMLSHKKTQQIEFNKGEEL